MIVFGTPHTILDCIVAYKCKQTIGIILKHLGCRLNMASHFMLMATKQHASLMLAVLLLQLNNVSKN